MRTLLILPFILLASVLFGQNLKKETGLKTINKKVIQAQLEFLSSDWMEGREAGTKGNYLAGDYLASMFKLYGLEPAGNEEAFVANRYQKLLGANNEVKSSYFQPFSAIEISPSSNQKLAVINTGAHLQRTRLFDYQTDFNLPFVTQNLNITAPVVFVGYGFENKDLKYDSFEGMDIKGKIILRISGTPGLNNPSSLAAKRSSEINFSISSKQKNEQAFQKGALAILEYNPDKNEQEGWKKPEQFYYNEAMYEGEKKPQSFYDKKLKLPSDKNSPAIISVSKKIFDELLAGSEIQLESVLAKSEKLEQVSSELKAKVKLQLSAKRKTVKLRNIIGVIEGENKDKIMVVGAHYDHLGKYNGQIFNGADDNGSGVVAVTTIAKAFMESGAKPKCTLVFALWDGEERGLLGSRSYIENSKTIGKTLLYLNFDMIGRNGSANAPGNKVAMIYTKAYNNLVDISKKHIKKYNLKLNVNFSGVEKPTGGSDNSGFARKEIPIFWFHTGGHTDYHKASDHAELINWEKMTDIVKLSYLNMWEFANTPEAFE